MLMPSARLNITILYGGPYTGMLYPIHAQFAELNLELYETRTSPTIYCDYDRDEIHSDHSYNMNNNSEMARWNYNTRAYIGKKTESEFSDFQFRTRENFMFRNFSEHIGALSGLRQQTSLYATIAAVTPIFPKSTGRIFGITKHNLPGKTPEPDDNVSQRNF